MISYCSSINLLIYSCLVWYEQQDPREIDDNGQQEGMSILLSSLCHRIFIRNHFPFHFFSWCCPSIRFLSLFPRSTWRRSDGNADSWTVTPRSRCLTYNLLVHRTKPSRYQLKFSAFKTPDCFRHKNSAKNFDGEMH